MTKVKLSALLSEAKGKLGGVYFTGTPSGFVVRNIQRKTSKAFTDANTPQIIFANKIAAWHNLTPEEQLYYSSIAPKGLSGYNYFLSLDLTPSNYTEMLYTVTNFNFADITGSEVKNIMPVAPAGFANIPCAIKCIATIGAIPYEPEPIGLSLRMTTGADYFSLSVINAFQADNVQVSDVFGLIDGTGMTAVETNPQSGLDAFFTNYDSGGSGSAVLLMAYIQVPLT